MAYTREDIIDYIDGHIGSSISNDIRYNDCSYDVVVSGSMVPTIVFDTNDEYITLKFETRSLIDQNDELIGYEFVPKIQTNPFRIEEWADEAEKKFARWAAIADIAQRIYEIDFYVFEYFEDEDY